METGELETRLVTLCHIALSQVRAEMPAMESMPHVPARKALEVMISLGHCDEAIAKLHRLRTDFPAIVAELNELGERLRSVLRRGGERLRAQLEEEADRAAQAQERNIGEEPREGAIPNDWVPFSGFDEFNQFLWGLDAVEHLHTSLQRLSYTMDIGLWASFAQRHEARIRFLIEAAVRQFLRMREEENPYFEPVDFYPDRFWWRELAWSTYKGLEDHAGA